MDKKLKKMKEDLRKEGFVLLQHLTTAKVLDICVPAGSPSENDSKEYVLEEFPVPADTAEPFYGLNVVGESMIGIGIYPGDMLLLDRKIQAYPNNIVIARNQFGEYTVKIFYRDEHNKPWLVPANRQFEPIELDSDWEIVAVVKHIIHAQPLATSQFCQNVINDYKKTMRKKYVPSYDEVHKALAAACDKMKERNDTTTRIWFAVYRAMVDCHLISKGDYESFLDILQDHLSELPNIDTHDLQTKVEVDGFTRRVSSWNQSTAPVKGKRFNDYKEVAMAFIMAMPEEATEEE